MTRSATTQPSHVRRDRPEQDLPGDVQKAARRVLENALVSKDMAALYEDLLDKEIEVPSISEVREAPLATGYDPDEKSEVTNIGIIAATVTVDTVAEKTAAVDVTYTGDAAITTARLTIDSALPIKEITSEYDFEYNPDNGDIVVYLTDGSEIDGVLFTINTNRRSSGRREYPVDLELIEVTGADAEVIRRSCS
jgi:hypothetical protein